MLLIFLLLAFLAATDRAANPTQMLPQREEKALAAGLRPTAKSTPTVTATPKPPVRIPTPGSLKPEASYILSATSPETVKKQALPPLRIRIASIGVDAPIVPTGLDPNGEMEAPQGPNDVGWYTASAIPGQVGNAVLSGHVDWKTQTAVFWRLRELKPGDSIDVYSTDGMQLSFTVTWSQSYPDNAVPLAEILAKSSQPILTIITCAGQFDRDSRNYSHRLVVRAHKT